MFPGCTELDIRARHQDILREAGLEPLLGQRGAQTAKGGPFLERLLLTLMAVLGL
jgi:hypothetical protein